MGGVDAASLLKRLALRPQPALSQRHRAHVLERARAEAGRRRTRLAAAAADSFAQTSVAVSGSLWWKALFVKPKVLAGGGAAFLAAMLLWGWQAGALRHATESADTDAILTWTGATGGATTSDVDARLARARAHVASIAKELSDPDIDRVLTRTHRDVADLENTSTD